LANFIDKTDYPNLVDQIQNYNLSSKSTFIDIGSGFGKPVFHAALQASQY